MENRIAKGTKACPYCGEEIKVVAIKCKHCGEHLSEEEDLANSPKTKGGGQVARTGSRSVQSKKKQQASVAQQNPKSSRKGLFGQEVSFSPEEADEAVGVFEDLKNQAWYEIEWKPNNGESHTVFWYPWYMLLIPFAPLYYVFKYGHLYWFDNLYMIEENNITYVGLKPSWPVLLSIWFAGGMVNLVGLLSITGLIFTVPLSVGIWYLNKYVCSVRLNRALASR